MRPFTAVCLLVFVTSVSVFAADPPKPIADALVALKKAASASADEKEKAAIVRSIRYLEASLIVPKNDNAKLADFADYPAKYKGKRLVFELRMGGDRRFTLEDAKGVTLKLSSFVGQNEVVIMADLPRDAMGLPNMRMGDTALFTIDCKEGSHDRGNVIVFVERPK